MYIIIICNILHKYANKNKYKYFCILKLYKKTIVANTFFYNDKMILDSYYI